MSVLFLEYLFASFRATSGVQVVSVVTTLEFVRLLLLSVRHSSGVTARSYFAYCHPDACIERDTFMYFLHEDLYTS